MTVVQYSLADIHDIKNKGIKYILDEPIVNIINHISSRVGSPAYVKTPQFSNKTNNTLRRNKQKQESDENWNTIRQFTPTPRIARVGIDKSLDIIRKTLNKITSHTYEALYPILIEELDKVIATDPSELQSLGDTIFSIVSETGFYSEMYANLFTSLYHKYDFLRKALTETLTQFEEQTENIQYCNPDIDYDAFCKNNKENTRRKSVAVFLVNLAKNNIIKIHDIGVIISNIQLRILSLIEIEKQSEIVDELSEISGNMIITGKEIMTSWNKWDSLVDTVQLFSRMKTKEHVSLSNKTVFKHMDILDCLNK